MMSTPCGPTIRQLPSSSTRRRADEEAGAGSDDRGITGRAEVVESRMAADPDGPPGLRVEAGQRGLEALGAFGRHVRVDVAALERDLDAALVALEVEHRVELLAQPSGVAIARPL